MKSLPLILSAAVALGLGGAAHATPREVTYYLAQAGEVATAELAAAGVDAGRGLRVKARVNSDGRLTGARVVTSSGSLETDQKATQALRRLKVATPPNILIGAEVVVAVAQAPIETAKAN